jgi:hypothetical protein
MTTISAENTNDFEDFIPMLLYGGNFNDNSEK